MSKSPARPKVRTVEGVALSPYARAGERRDLDVNDPQVARYLRDGVLKTVATQHTEEGDPPGEGEFVGGLTVQFGEDGTLNAPTE